MARGTIIHRCPADRLLATCLLEPELLQRVARGAEASGRVGGEHSTFTVEQHPVLTLHGPWASTVWSDEEAAREFIQNDRWLKLLALRAGISLSTLRVEGSEALTREARELLGVAAQARTEPLQVVR